MQQHTFGAQRQSPEPTVDAVNALEDLRFTRRAMSAVVELLDVQQSHPDALGHVGRENFYALMDLVQRFQAEGGEDAESFIPDCIGAVSDLLLPDTGSESLSRERLGSLLHVIGLVEDRCVQRIADAFMAARAEDQLVEQRLRKAIDGGRA